MGGLKICEKGPPGEKEQYLRKNELNWEEKESHWATIILHCPPTQAHQHRYVYEQSQYNTHLYPDVSARHLGEARAGGGGPGRGRGHLAQAMPTMPMGRQPRLGLADLALRETPLPLELLLHVLPDLPVQGLVEDVQELDGLPLGQLVRGGPRAGGGLVLARGRLQEGRQGVSVDQDNCREGKVSEMNILKPFLYNVFSILAKYRRVLLTAYPKLALPQLSRSSPLRQSRS